MGIIGYVYRTDCSCGKVYVGLSRKIDLNSCMTYLGSGHAFLKHLKINDDHTQEKTILKFFTDNSLLEEYESTLIKITKKRFQENCLNLTTRKQSYSCEECGSYSSHIKTCSKYRLNICSECGSKNKGSHFKVCSKSNVTVCIECKGKSGQHFKFCTLYNAKKVCPECNKTSGPHKNNCSSYKIPKSCEECNSKLRHKKTCSQYHYKKCEECDGTLNSHKSICSKFKIKGFCLDCEASFGQHYKKCKKYIEKKSCEACGAKSGNHKKLCPKVPKSAKT